VPMPWAAGGGGFVSVLHARWICHSWVRIISVLPKGMGFAMTKFNWQAETSVLQSGC